MNARMERQTPPGIYRITATVYLPQVTKRVITIGDGRKKSFGTQMVVCRGLSPNVAKLRVR